MPRPRRCRRIGFRPDVMYFKPAGVSLANLKETVLNMEELEAIRLKDVLGLDQEKAAEKMNVSQPTFHRTITSARKKIAHALVEGESIKIEGGKFKLTHGHHNKHRS